MGAQRSEQGAVQGARTCTVQGAQGSEQGAVQSGGGPWCKERGTDSLKMDPGATSALDWTERSLPSFPPKSRTFHTSCVLHSPPEDRGCACHRSHVLHVTTAPPICTSLRSLALCAQPAPLSCTTHLHLLRRAAEAQPLRMAMHLRGGSALLPGKHAVCFGPCCGAACDLKGSACNGPAGDMRTPEALNVPSYYTESTCALVHACYPSCAR